MNISQWLAKVYRSNEQLRPRFKEDLYKVKEAFSIIKNKNIPIDLFKFNDFNSLLDETDKFKDVQSNKEIKKEQRQELLKDVVRILDDEHWRVEVPRTEQSSCELGRGTRWCASSDKNNMFEYYNEDGNLYVITNKQNNKKYQLHYTNEIQLMDERDREVKKTVLPPIVWKLTSEFERKDRNKIIYVNEKGQISREDGPAVEDADYGYKAWYLNDKFHREDGPAVEDADGTKFWYLNDKFHREDGPAVEDAGGSKWWYLNGKKHREDGPAVEYAGGSKAWYLNGKKHREDGPAVEYAGGTKEWYLNGERHREDGPAVENADGDKEWYLNGKNLTKKQFDFDIEMKGKKNSKIK